MKKFFRADTTIVGTSRHYRDWFDADNAEDAIAQADAEAQASGLPMDNTRKVVVVECDPKTLKPINPQQQPS